MQAAEESGQFTYVPRSSPEKDRNDDDDDIRPGVNTDGVKPGLDVDRDHPGGASPSPTPETDRVNQKTVSTYMHCALILINISCQGIQALSASRC